MIGAVRFRQNASWGFHGVGKLFGAVSNPDAHKTRIQSVRHEDNDIVDEF